MNPFFPLRRDAIAASPILSQVRRCITAAKPTAPGSISRSPGHDFYRNIPSPVNCAVYVAF